jgi:hypothetical protein
MTEKLKILFVMGAGGTRIDFVSGWLGTLPNFVNSNWTLHPHYGVSSGFQTSLKELDRLFCPISNLLPNVELDSQSKITYAASYHGVALESLREEIIENKIKLSKITFTREQFVDITWEFAVKVFLRPLIEYDRYQKKDKDRLEYGIDRLIAYCDNIPIHDITDELRIRSVKDKIRNHLLGLHYLWRDDSALLGMPYTPLEFNKLFSVAGGSRYLCEQLNILDSTARHHDFWDAMLPFATSEDSYDVWGYHWTRGDVLAAMETICFEDK